jgi:hypothetical protein
MAKPELYKQWDKCPHCGCTERVAARYMADKVLPPSVQKPEMWGLTILVVQMGNPEQSLGWGLPTLVLYRDICWECGREYTFRVDQVVAPVTAKLVPPGGQKQGFGFNPHHR